MNKYMFGVCVASVFSRELGDDDCLVTTDGEEGIDIFPFWDLLPPEERHVEHICGFDEYGRKTLHHDVVSGILDAQSGFPRGPTSRIAKASLTNFLMKVPQSHGVDVDIIVESTISSMIEIGIATVNRQQLMSQTLAPIPVRQCPPDLPCSRQSPPRGPRAWLVPPRSKPAVRQVPTRLKGGAQGGH